MNYDVSSHAYPMNEVIYSLLWRSIVSAELPLKNI